jgi:DNA mismatch repair protein MutS
LRALENPGATRKPARQASADNPQLSLFPSQSHPLVETLADIDPDRLNPRQALELLYRLKELAG